METLLLTSERVDRIITRLACEVIERNRGVDNIQIIGIEKKGVEVAKRIAAAIMAMESVSVGVTPLDVSSFRDDRSVERVAVNGSAGPDVTDKDVVLVDDVLFSGRTVRAALDAVVQFGRPRSIQLLVLVDRGHRAYPIRPDYVGRKIQTKAEERIAVRVDAACAVFLEE